MYVWTILATLILGFAAWVLISGFVRTWRLYHGVHVITCPENLRPAAVNVAAFDAAKWAAITGETDLHLKSCSRWPEMAGCDEACLRQIQESPHGCAVQTIVAQWYEGKSCHFCGRHIERIVWHERPPAVRTREGQTAEWKDIAPQDLQVVFMTADAVCWACHVVETFRREHPELVVERMRAAVENPPIAPSTAVY